MGNWREQAISEPEQSKDNLMQFRTLMNPGTPNSGKKMATACRRLLCLAAGAAPAFAFMLALAVLATGSAQAQTYHETVLYSFKGGTDGSTPYAGVVQDAQGNLYGTTYQGGTSNMGTVFKVDTTGTETVLYSFTGTGGDGANPRGGLVRDTQGNLYGTTYQGGNLACSPPSGCGTVFKLDTTGKETVLHSFTDAPDGALPEAGLVQDTQGNLFGTTLHGGSQGAGTVFKLDTTGKESVLYSFGSVGGDGTFPQAGVVLDSQGDMYGTTFTGGTGGDGAVFKVDKTGKETVLYSFTGMNGDGEEPYYAGVVRDGQGNLYGTTVYGGSSVFGTVYKVDTTGKETVLYSFTGGTKDGAYPEAGLVLDAQGNLYGTTLEGGAFGGGTVFEVDATGKETVLYSFPGTNGDGSAPMAGLVLDMVGNLYGTTTSGGAASRGTVFRVGRVQFVPVPPCRLVDTRPHPIQGMMTETFNLPQLAKQSKGCPMLDLSSAAAYSLNVTVVPQGMLGYLTIWPAGQSQPVVSTLNSYDGRVKANAAIVPAGASGAVNVYVTNTTDVLLDIDGYFAPASQSTLTFYPLPPCRVADTRFATGFGSGLGAPYLMAQMERDFPVLNAASNTVPCNIPSSAEAYSLNFTAVPHGFLGYLTVWPTGQSQPIVSTLNAYGGQITANAAIVPAGISGEISTYALDDTDLVIDINGYFAPGQGGLSLYPLVPCRVSDTRPPYGGNGPFKGTLSPPVDVVNSPCAVPNVAAAYVLNATVVPKGEMGYLTLWPDSLGLQQPIVSTLNALDGIVTSNMAIVPAGNQGGKINAYADEDTSLTDLVLDISSYFGP
jgi:uncharacterized repeat protein (TIGR03803 family)